MKNILYTFGILILSVSAIVAQGIYDTDVITTIELTFEESNWEQILQDSFALGQGGRLKADMEINGVIRDSVGVRFRAPSTYKVDNPKNSLNIKLDFLKNQSIQGVEVLKLSNGAKDPSFLREVLAFEIARKYMVAPRANYARVFINGTYYGLFSNAESVNRRFVSDNFLSDNDNVRFEGNPDYTFDPPNPPFGCQTGLGASLEFLGNGIACYLPHYDLQSDTGWDVLESTTQTMANSPNDSRQVLDMDRFIWKSVFHNLTVNLDSYLGAVPRNYALFQQDNGRFAPAIDDMNESFGRYPWLEVSQVGPNQPPIDEFINLDPFWGENDNQKPVLRNIFGNDTWKRMYVAHYRTMLKENFENGWYKMRAEALRSLIESAVSQDPNKIYSETDFNNNYTQSITDIFDNQTAFGITELMDARVAYLQNFPEFMATPPTIGIPQYTPQFPMPGEAVTITTTVQNSDVVWLGARGGSNEMFELTQMFDDGNHGDGAAGDGVFGAEVNAGISGLQYYVYAENSEAGMFAPEHAEYEFYEVGAAGDLVINELVADNETIQADPDGEFDDWIELYNNSNQSIDISGWYLTDNSNNLAKWQFPSGSVIDPGEYLIIWADDDLMQDGLHASFKLSNNGEECLLVDQGLNIIDAVVFGPQGNDMAWARCPNGRGAFETRTPSFALSNDNSCMVATNDWENIFDLDVYPNPANDWLKIETDYPQEILIELWNSTGQLIIQEEMQFETNISTSELPEGLYFLKIGEGGVKKVVISRG